MKKNKRLSKKTRTYILMALPALVLFAIFNTVPLITGFVYSGSIPNFV